MPVASEENGASAIQASDKDTPVLRGKLNPDIERHVIGLLGYQCQPAYEFLEVRQT
jgi:hypothetical protein